MKITVELEIDLPDNGATNKEVREYLEFFLAGWGSIRSDNPFFEE